MMIDIVIFRIIAPNKFALSFKRFLFCNFAKEYGKLISMLIIMKTVWNYFLSKYIYMYVYIFLSTGDYIVRTMRWSISQAVFVSVLPVVYACASLKLFSDALSYRSAYVYQHVMYQERSYRDPTNAPSSRIHVDARSCVSDLVIQVCGLYIFRFRIYMSIYIIYLSHFKINLLNINFVEKKSRIVGSVKIIFAEEIEGEIIYF